MAHKSPVNAAKKLLEKANKLVKHSWDRITEPKSRNASPSTSNRGSIEVTALGSNDPLNQNPTLYASKSVSADGPTVSLPPLDSNAASHQDFSSSFNSNTPNTSGSPYISPLSSSGIGE
ncbi:hypothetical protein CVT25_014347 [Psilocybe cyanescens]|uniref:Uncharacterized protein n=1 Tax=Psilocybe cyanescens TaxID=93625 RepID=A0A409WUG4_PSICY|nr:hypothetical protein CVT25_014347 [Psilocybe cyanescens]